MMNIEAKQQYMETLRERYLRAEKKEKGKILDEYCRNTGEDRKYAIKKFRYKVKVKKKEERKKRKEYYDGNVRAALAVMWKIFDNPCGQRLETILKNETDRMRILKELSCSDETAVMLKRITSSTIDKKLEHEKEEERAKRKYKPTHTFPLKSEVPTKTSAELDRKHPGVVQIDFVEHCGASAAGEYANSLSIVDIYSGWWEGDAVMGKGQERALSAIDEARKRSPFVWKEMHPDNGSNIMNYHIFSYGLREDIELSRSRPYKKNDNCFVEQKNSTHIRQPIGYLRYDTEAEKNILSALYRNELRLYKNFFQPVIKLVSKTRVKGRIKKKYDTPKTPYHRIMQSPIVSLEKKTELKKCYDSLNPAQLKREIEGTLKNLQKVDDKKKGSLVEANPKKLQVISVSSLIIQPVGAQRLSVS
jgi:hypothetical protein